MWCTHGHLRKTKYGSSVVEVVGDRGSRRGEDRGWGGGGEETKEKKKKEETGDWERRVCWCIFTSIN